jgi:hypothetical protein
MEEVPMTDWYERRDELDPGMVFNSCYGIVKLDHRKPGDGTDWVVQTWYPGRSDIPGYERGFWCHDEDSIHPGDLTERLPDNYGTQV